RDSAWSTPRSPILSRGSDSNREKSNDLRDDRCSDALSQTMVIQKPHGFRARPHDSSGSWFSITVLECDFSNQPRGDGFREGETRSNRGFEPSSLVFSPLLSGPRYADVLAFISLLKRGVSTVAALKSTLGVVAERFQHIVTQTAEEQESRRQRIKSLREYQRKLDRFGVLSVEEEQ